MKPLAVENSIYNIKRTPQALLSPTVIQQVLESKKEQMT